MNMHRLTDTLFELATALDRTDMPMELRVNYVRRQLALLCKEQMDAPNLTPLEVALAKALKQAHKYVEYTECFGGKTMARQDMESALTAWRNFRPTVTGIGIGATCLNDAEYNYGEVEKLIARAEKINEAPLPLPEIWA